LGVHETEHDWMLSTMAMSDGSHLRDLYLIDADAMTISPIDDAAAKRLMSGLQYVTQDRLIHRDRELLAGFDVTVDGAREAAVVFTSFRETSAAERAALMLIAWGEAIKYTQSLFTAVTRVTLDGQDLHAMLSPVVAELDASTTWYGMVSVARDEGTFLESLQVDLGAYHEAQQAYPVRVTPDAMAQLGPYAGSILWDLHPLPHAVKPVGRLEPVKAMARLTLEHLEAYKAFLNYEMAAGRAGDTVTAQMAAAVESLQSGRMRRIGGANIGGPSLGSPTLISPELP
jgi:hypothetical protein